MIHKEQERFTIILITKRSLFVLGQVAK